MQPHTTQPAGETSPTATPASAARRAILLHDGLSFLVLSLVAIVLYGITLLLFRSFESHRSDLAVHWAQVGRQSLAANKPADAIYALRTALSYAPDDRADQLLLAQALENDGRLDEATNYFDNLWEQTPGDGFINLHLARLARRKGETVQATDYYRASIFGNWGLAGPVRRRDTRLELADFLLGQHELTAAHAELFIAAANNSQDAALSLAVASRLAASGDLNDALVYDTRAVSLAPHNREYLATAGRTAFELGSFSTATALFVRALDSPPAAEQAALPELQQTALEADLTRARRAGELTLARDLPQPERVAHLAVASRVAVARLAACINQVAPELPAVPAAPAEPAHGKDAALGKGATRGKDLAAGRPAHSGRQPAAPPPVEPGLPLDLASLRARWTAALTRPAQKLVADNADAQDSEAQLIYETEATAAQRCGAPAGDDSLLLMLAELAERRGGASH